MDRVFLPLRGGGAGGGGGGGHLLTCSPSTTFFRLAQTSAREDLFCRQIFLPSAQLRCLVLPQLQGFAKVLKSCDALDIWKAICESVPCENIKYKYNTRFILLLLLEMRCTCVILICQIVSSWGQNKL